MLVVIVKVPALPLAPVSRYTACHNNKQFFHITMSLLCCPVKVPHMFEGGLAPVGLAATTVSPEVPQAPSLLSPARGGCAVTKLSKSKRI